MFRHLVRHDIKFGEYREFVAALKEVNAQAPSAGLPTYRAWRSNFGGLNEVWLEADYEGLDAHVAAFENARSHEAFMTAFLRMGSHIASGQDWPLEEIEL